LYQLSAPSLRFFLAKGWETVDHKVRIHVVRDLAVKFQKSAVEQGTTSVVPKMAEMKGPALAPEE
jgi:hypothetical protein